MAKRLTDPTVEVVNTPNPNAWVGCVDPSSTEDHSTGDDKRISAVNFVTKMPMTGFVAGADSPVVSTDTLVEALGKLQTQVENAGQDLTQPTTIGVGSSLGTLTVHGHDAADEALVVRAAGSQSADIFLIEDNSGNDFFGIGSGGMATLGFSTKTTTTRLMLNAAASAQVDIQFAHAGSTKWIQYLHGSGSDLSFYDNADRLRLHSGGGVTVNGTSSVGTFTAYGHDDGISSAVIRATNGQTANTFAVQAFAGNDLFTVDRCGAATVKCSNPTTLYLESTAVGQPANVIQFRDTGGDTGYIGFGSGSSDDFTMYNSTGGNVNITAYSSGNVVLTAFPGVISIVGRVELGTHNFYDLGTVSSAFRDGYFGRKLAIGGAQLATTTIYGHDAADEALLIRAADTQSANIVDVQNNAGTSLFSVSSTGLVKAGASNSILNLDGSAITIGGGSSGTRSTGVGHGGLIASGYYASAFGWRAEVSATTGAAIGAFAECEHNAALGLPKGQKDVFRKHFPRIQSLHAKTTDATQTAMDAPGSGAVDTVPCPLASNRSASISGTVIALKSDSTETASWQIHAVVQNNGGTMSLVGTPVITSLNNNSDAWDCEVSVNDTDDTWEILVTGEASTTIRWGAELLVNEMSH